MSGVRSWALLVDDPDAPGGVIRYLPSHPHEGAVGKPSNDDSARVIGAGGLAGEGFDAHAHAGDAGLHLDLGDI